MQMWSELLLLALLQSATEWSSPVQTRTRRCWGPQRCKNSYQQPRPHGQGPRILPGAFYFHPCLFLSCPYGAWDTALNEVLCLNCTFCKSYSEEHLRRGESALMQTGEMKAWICRVAEGLPEALRPEGHSSTQTRAPPSTGCLAGGLGLIPQASTTRSLPISLLRFSR